MVLFIIGNGFDIGHGMQTGYKHFYHFLKTNYKDFFKSVASLFIADFETDPFWCDFEEGLADFTPEYFIDQKLSPQQTSEIALNFQELLCQYFKEWICSMIPSQNSNLSLFTSNAFFINFNYTDTLETIYHVPPEKILHIHGQASQPKSKLIIGHSSKATIDDMCKSYEIIKNDNLECSLEELNYLIVAEMLLFTVKKPTDTIIQHKLQPIDFQQVSEIVVLGHSLGTVDWPYFKFIKGHLAQSVHWKFSAYCERDKDQIILCVKAFQITDYSIDSLQNLISQYSPN